jgi:NitT/TauT family transport system ATP-binding protein
MGPDDRVAVTLSEVTKAFATADGSAYTAIKDISLDVGEGTFLAIVGPSGCGKSTILNIAAGLDQPSAGRVHIYGQPLAGINRRASYIFQQDAILPWKTVLDNVVLGLRLRGADRREAMELGTRWLSRVGLTDFAGHFPYQLSGGMRKRVAIAQSWAVDPEMFFMDEPFSALDVQTRQMMEAELLSLWAGSNKTVLFVTHDLDEAIALADEVVVLSAGPASHVMGRYPVVLARPRNLLEIRNDSDYVDLYREIWSTLRDEVRKSYERNPVPQAG